MSDRGTHATEAYGFPSGCGFLSPEDVEAVIDGRLPAERWSEFERHVHSGCVGCSTLAADLEIFRTVVAQGPVDAERREADRVAATERARLVEEIRRVTPRPAQAPTGFTWWRWLAPVAATLVVAVGAWMLVRDHRPAGTLAIALPDGSRYVAEVRPFNAPPVLRGEPNLNDLWRRAGSSYEAGDYDSAAKGFLEIESRSPGSFDAMFYRGVALLAAGKTVEAQRTLAEARAAATRDDDPTSNLAWFQGLAALAAHDLPAARRLLEEAAQDGGVHSLEARELLRRAFP